VVSLHTASRAPLLTWTPGTRLPLPPAEDLAAWARRLRGAERRAVRDAAEAVAQDGGPLAAAAQLILTVTAE